MSDKKKTIIACEILRLEMEAVIAGTEAELNLIEASLHRTPPKMPDRLNAAIKAAENSGAGEIIMGYGLCSHGVNGLTSNRNLRIARCHDCLGLLLGSPSRHLDVLAKWPSAFYMFAGMVEAAFDPLSVLERDYVPRLGAKKAFRGLELVLRNYTHFAYIENNVSSDKKYRKSFLENCRAFQKEPLELTSNLDYFRRLIHGPRQPMEDFIQLHPGEHLTSEAFYDGSASSGSGPAEPSTGCLEVAGQQRIHL